MALITLRELGNAGRLGNQLFQVASTLGLADRHGMRPILPAWDYQPYFSVPEEFFGEVPDDAVNATEFVPHIDERARLFLQDHNLFSHMMPTIREYFSPSKTALSVLEGNESFRGLIEPILSVHVRRGDNVPGQDPGTPNKHLWHPLPPPEYYYRAIDELCPGVQSVAFFSDEIEWVRRNIAMNFTHEGHLRQLSGEKLQDQVYYHEGVTRPKEHEKAYKTAPVLDWPDFFMQAACDRHVLSNSTYGIMAALVSGDVAAVYPWPMFGPNLDYVDASLLFPDTWRRLEARRC